MTDQMISRALKQLVFVLLLPSSFLGVQLPLRVYTTADGLASNRINQIFRDSRGFLWFCTTEGLSRFDGYRFTNFGPAQGLRFPITNMVETGSGEYWIASTRGLSHLNAASSGQLFDTYLPEDKAASQIYAVTVDHTGILWCATARGLYRMDPSLSPLRLSPAEIPIQPRQTYDDRVIDELLVDRDGDLWAGGFSGLYHRRADQRWERFTVSDGLPNLHVSALFQDSTGQVWLGTWGGLCRVQQTASGSVKKFVRVKTGLAQKVLVSAILEPAPGQLWVGSDLGLSHYFLNGDEEKSENFTTANGLNSTSISALAEDRASNLWIAAQGAVKLSRTGFLTYDQRDGLAYFRIRSIFESRDGDLCALGDDRKSEGINRFNGLGFESLGLNLQRFVRDWGWGRTQLTFQDHTGDWWVTTGQGLFLFAPVPAFSHLTKAPPKSVYNHQNGLVPESVFRVFEDSRGDVWISTVSAVLDGVTRWERATGRLHPFRDKQASAFAEDRAGNMWIANGGQLVRYRNNQFTTVLDDTNVPSGITALFVDHLGRVWGAWGGGILRIDLPDAEAPQVARYTTADGLASAVVLGITEDAWGRIYASNLHGIDSFYPSSPLRVKHYTLADGLVAGAYIAAFRDRRGCLWFSSPTGLSRLEPAPDLPSKPAPVFITGLEVRGKPQNISPLGEAHLAGLRFAAGQDQIQVDFVGLDFAPGDALRYQYRLGNADWSAATDQRSVNYASLAAGSYSFQVRAVTADGLPSTQPATVAFTILSPYWQTWWFRTLLLAIALSVLYGFYHNRVSQLLKLERIRTQIATDLHDDLGSKLSQIAILSEVARQNKAGEQGDSLADIAHLARTSTESIGDIVWAINPAHDRLEDMTYRMRRFANDLFGLSGVTIQFRTVVGTGHGEIEAGIRQQIFLIFKEILHNSFKHANCTEISVDLLHNRDELQLRVQDNGRGFPTARIVYGNGLRSIQARSKRLGAHITTDSTPGKGTTVHLRVPLRSKLREKLSRYYPNG